MVGGGFRIVQNVPPFILAGNEPLRFCGLNSIGLKRRGFSTEDIDALKKAYNFIYNSGLNFSQAKEKIKQEMNPHPLVDEVIEFINNSPRGIIRH
jgi:UDP-N-acetylglucosamine acyltransferase